MLGKTIMAATVKSLRKSRDKAKLKTKTKKPTRLF